MSTKKKDNTTGEMILEKKETQADIQARMETGKIEIMKVVLFFDLFILFPSIFIEVEL